MTTVPKTKSYVANVVLVVGFLLALPLWREFREPGQPLWDVFLGIILVGVLAGVFFGLRYLQRNAVEVGEARFKTADNEGE